MMPSSKKPYQRFAPEETSRVLEALRIPYEPVLCPRCSTPLLLGGTDELDDSPGLRWLYRCTSCHRGLAVSVTTLRDRDPVPGPDLKYP